MSILDQRPVTKYDWPEDFEHENGQYIGKCECGAQFVGHKRRPICKACAMKNARTTIAELTAKVERYDAVSKELLRVANLRNERDIDIQDGQPHTAEWIYAWEALEELTKE